MLVPHDTLVIVADGRKMLMLRNQGDASQLDLQVARKEIHESPKDREQKTDASGRASSTQSGPGSPAIAQGGSMHAQGEGAQFAPSRGSLEEPDYHQLEEDRFAADVADILEAAALQSEFDRLIIVAPAKTLGELRKHYHKEVSARIVVEIDKDVTNQPVPLIEKMLAEA